MISNYKPFKSASSIFALILIFTFHTDIFSQTKNLNYYVENAVKNNPVIKENTKLISTEALRKELIYSQYKKPHIFGTANYLFAPSFGEVGYDSAVTNGGLYSALINLEMPLFTGFSSDAKIEEIKNDIASYSNTILATEHEIRKNIADQYFRVFQEQEQITAIDEILKILDFQKGIVEKMAERSIGKISDITLIDIEIQSQLIAKKQLQTNLEADLMDLNLLAGIDDTVVVSLEEPMIQLTPDVKDNSNFLLSYNLDSLKLITEQKLNETSYRPQFTFFVNGGLNAVTYDEMWKKVGVSTGFNISFDIFNGGQKNLNDKLTEIKKQNISTSKAIFLSQNQKRKKYLLKEIDDLKKLSEPLEKQIENYQKLLNLYSSEFITGEVSLLDYINVLKNYVTFKSEIINNKNQQSIIINEYNYWNW